MPHIELQSACLYCIPTNIYRIDSNPEHRQMTFFVTFDTWSQLLVSAWHETFFSQGSTIFDHSLDKRTIVRHAAVDGYNSHWLKKHVHFSNGRARLAFCYRFPFIFRSLSVTFSVRFPLRFPLVKHSTL